MTRRQQLTLLYGAFAVFWLLLAISPLDRPTWLLENTLVFAGIGVLYSLRRHVPFTMASHTLVVFFLGLHAIGAHYTYSLVPYDAAFQSLTGDSLNGVLGLSRNHYDRLVHFGYGLLLALPMRELLMRLAGVRGFWSYFLPLDLVMSSSLFYELLEWAAAVVFGGGLGAAFLGTQGDEWDAHRDMALAGIGGLIAILLVYARNRSTRDRSGDRELP
jgi:putative membrane protein